MGENLGWMTNIFECHLGIKARENAPKGLVWLWPPPQISKAILNHFSEPRWGAEILHRQRQTTDHCVSCQSKTGEDTESECMALNWAFLNYKEEKGAPSGSREQLSDMRKSLKPNMVQGILFFLVSTVIVGSKDTRKPLCFNWFSQAHPRAFLGKNK